MNDYILSSSPQHFAKLEMLVLDEEKLREACSYGDTEVIESLLNKGININSQNRINGWTPLHWACKRSNAKVVELLLHKGANPDIKNVKNETSLQMTIKQEIIDIFDKHEGIPAFPSSMEFSPAKINGVTNDIISISKSSVVQNNSSNGHSASVTSDLNGFMPEKSHIGMQTITVPQKDAFTITDQIVSKKAITLKVRLAATSDPDFIEMDVFPASLTFGSLLSACAIELSVNPQHIERLRKLPNTRLRCDRDVQRLTDFQELEVVVKGISGRNEGLNRTKTNHASSTNNYQPISNFKNQTILY